MFGEGRPKQATLATQFLEKARAREKDRRGMLEQVSELNRVSF